MKKILIISFVCLATIALTLWIFRLSILNIFMESTLNANKEKYISYSPETNLIKYWDLLEKDHEVLKQIPFFNVQVGNLNDAGPFLNPIMTWTGLETKDQSKRLNIDKGLEQKIKDYFAGKKFDLNEINLDFSWFKELYKFDHWNYEFHPPVSAQTIEYKFYNQPVPDGNLLTWARARLLQGLKEKNIISAIEDNRQLARLLFLNEDLVGTMVSIAILKHEVEIVKMLDENEQKKIKTLTLKDVEVAKRFFWAQKSFFDLRLSNDLFQKFSKFEVGLCHGLYQALSDSKAFYRILYDEMPKSFDRLDQLVKQTDPKCRNSYVRQKWKDPNYQALFEKDQSIFEQTSISADGVDPNSIPGSFTIEDAEKYPVLAKAVMYIIMSVAQPDYVSRSYSEAK